MRVLVTTGRFPYSLSVLRALARSGHEVHVTESFAGAPASRSRYVAGHLVTPPPIPQPLEFVDAVAVYADERSIEAIVPIFEEIFPLAALRERLGADVRLLAAPFEVLAELHHKARFRALAERLGLPTPATVVVEDAAALREGVGAFERWIAKPAFSRAGTRIVTNVGPRAEQTSLGEVEPSAENPWLVQEFVEGEDLASLAVARGGRIVAFAVYEEPLEAEGGYSVRQRAISAPRTLEIAATVAGRLGFEGFIGFDYRLAEDGPLLIECNPRCSAGAGLFGEVELARALLGDPGEEPAVVAAGTETQFDTGVAAESFHGIGSVRRTLRELGESPGAYLDPRDPIADLAGWMRFRHDSRVSSREHLAIVDVKLRDVCWNGEPLL